jgi:formylmethanofuran dehydrogenase subunit E
MVNNAFVKDLAKGIKNTPLRQELPAGAGRRYEPEVGVGKHNERIHKESRYADTHKNLPFSFRKPPKPAGKSSVISCDNCGHITSGTTATVGMICTNCGKFSSVSEVKFDG